MRRCQNWLKSYLEYTSGTEAPEAFNFWVGVGVISAVLKRKVYIDQLYFKWIPNFFIVLVAPPALLTKSTTINTGARLLSDLGPSLVTLGPDALTWQALTQLMAESTEVIQMRDGSTTSMSCVAFFISELGTMLDFKDTRMIDVLVDLWDGRDGAWRRATKTSGKDFVSQPCITVVAGTTPAWLSEQMPKVLLDAGFVSRCLFVRAASKRQLIAYPRYAAPGAVQVRDALLHDLERISLLNGEFELTPEARRFGEEWYESLYKDILSSGRDVQGYLGRKQTHAHKLAMVLSASRGDSMQITETDLREAVALLDALQLEIPAMVKTINTTVHGAHFDQMIKVLQGRGGSMTRAELYRNYFAHMLSSREFSELIDSGVQAGVITQAVNGSTVFIKLAINITP